MVLLLNLIGLTVVVFMVYLLSPIVWDFEARAKGGLGIRFDDDYGARLGVMPRDGTSDDVRWFEIEPCYVYHTLNAYEDGDEIVVEGGINFLNLTAFVNEPAYWGAEFRMSF